MPGSLKLLRSVPETRHTEPWDLIVGRFRVWGLGFRGSGLGFRVWGSGSTGGFGVATQNMQHKCLGVRTLGSQFWNYPCVPGNSFEGVKKCVLRILVQGVRQSL